MYTTADVTPKLVRMHSDKVVLVHDTIRLTARQIDQRVERLASALLHLGLQPGDRVAVMMRNNHRYIELPFVAGRAGLILVPVNALLMEQEVQRILNDCGARAVITMELQLDMIEAIQSQLPHLAIRIGIEAQRQGWLDYDALLENDLPPAPPALQNENAPALLIYTSGTTGEPKGVMITHRSLLSNCTNFILETPIPSDAVYLAVSPFHHVSLLAHLSWFVRGCRVVVAPFHADTVAQLIEIEKVTDTLLVPTPIRALLDALDRHPRDLSSLRTLVYMGAPMPEVLLRRGLARLGPVFIQMYGSTESSTPCTVLRQSDHQLDGPPEAQRRLISCGRETTRVEVRVIDPAGNPVAPGEVGEIIVRADTVTPGYWDKPEVTAETIREGWLYTGDLARIDRAGYIYIVDRRKDMIISGGVNIYPREVEEVLYTHPAVQEVAVIGIPDEKWGEAVHAVIVTKPDLLASEGEFDTFCVEKLGFKRPKSYAFWPELPKNAAGKLDKRSIRTRYWVGRERQVI